MCENNDCIFISCDSKWTKISIDEVRTYNNIDTVNLATLSLPVNSSMHLTSRILAVREAGPAGVPGETWQYTAITRAKNIGGVITVSPPMITSFLDTAEPIVTFTSGAGAVLINLIGAANKTIHWVAKSEMIIVPYTP